jgi:predicted Rossmann-fold nucleotide-binding protein
MEAPSKAASQVGRETFGYTWKKLNTQLQPNSYLSKITEFDDLCFRIAALIADSDICVFFPGRIGTYAELGVAVERRSKGELVHPIIVVGDFFEWFFLGLENSNKNLMLPADPPTNSNQLYIRIDTPQAFQDFLGTL